MAGMRGTTTRRAGRPPARPTTSSSGRDGQHGGSLKEFIVQVMKGGGVMQVAEITTAIKRAGYRTKNKTLAHSVGVALREMKGVKRGGRGMFRFN